MSAYVDASPGATAKDLAEAMHTQAVDLWNRYWSEAGENVTFSQRLDVEELMRILTRLAYPKAAS